MTVSKDLILNLSILGTGTGAAEVLSVHKQIYKQTLGKLLQTEL